MPSAENWKSYLRLRRVVSELFEQSITTTSVPGYARGLNLILWKKWLKKLKCLQDYNRSYSSCPAVSQTMNSIFSPSTTTLKVMIDIWDLLWLTHLTGSVFITVGMYSGSALSLLTILYTTLVFPAKLSPTKTIFGNSQNQKE